ncbi:gas vesicle protein GvpJ [Nonomuraea sp. CA-218870]|uniref:gas vesicle protein GvpJ n=1 Tax=Nonomuraea sp. CA-218870 TaxID=3239998 RepID=UPI003D92C7B2
MSVQTASRGTAASGGGGGTNLADVIDTILDKGLVIDAFVRVSLVGIEVLTIDSRIVVASVDTYLRFAEAANRLDLSSTQKDLPEVVQGMTQGKAVEQGQGAAGGELEAAGGSDVQEEFAEPERRPRKARRGGEG